MSANEQVAGYVVEARIGVGGFGEVYRARHPLIGREVAIKVLHAKYSADPEAVSRFVAEARAVNQISHPNIVEIYDFGKLSDGREFCVMELLQGATLRDLLRDRKRLPLEEALPILMGIAEAVDAAHAAGIAHRDLKPDNVFILASGGIKLIDFGLAKLTRELDAPVTQSGSVFGTPLYMSPEQCRGKASDTRTDLYSYGVLVYQVLTGELPFSGDALELALHHLNDPPPMPSKRHDEITRDVDQVVLALLAKDPADRPPSLVNATAALSGSTPLRARRWPHRARQLAIVAAIALIAGAGLFWNRRSVAVADDCVPGASRLAGVWDVMTRVPISVRFAAVSRPDVASTWNLVGRELDAYSARWSTLWDAACHADDRKTDPLLYVQRQSCLEAALLQLRGVAGGLRVVDVRRFSRGFNITFVHTDTASLDDCTSVAVLREQRPPVPLDRRDEVTRLATESGIARAQVKDAIASGNRLKVDEGLAQIERISTRLEAIGQSGAAEANIRAEYLVSLADGDGSRIEPARIAIADGIRRAERSHADEQLAGLYLDRARLELTVGDLSVIQEALEKGEAALLRAGHSEGLTVLRAELDVRAGRLNDAVTRLREELARPIRWMETGAPNSQWAYPAPLDAQILHLLARLGRHDEAIAGARSLLTRIVEQLGEQHILTFWRHRFLERALFRDGRVADALRETDEEIKILRAIAGAPPTVIDVQVRRMSYALRLGLRPLVAQARKDAMRAGATDKMIVETAYAMGDLDLARLELENVTSLGSSAIDDFHAWLDFTSGDIVKMKEHASRVSPSVPATHSDDGWFYGVENAPWFLAFGDQKLSARQLATLAPLHEVADVYVKASSYSNDAYVYATLGRWADARASFQKARDLPIWLRSVGSSTIGSSSEVWLADLDAWLGTAYVETGDSNAALVPLEESLDAVMSCCDGFHYFAPMAELSLARALWATGGDKVRARGLAEQAREHYARLGSFREPDRQRAIRWLETHPLP